MGKMIDAATAAEKIGVNVQRLRLLCRQRRIPGARLVGRVWMLPPDFKVTPGTRGPETIQARTVAAAKKAIAKSENAEKEYDALAKKRGLPRYAHGDLPLFEPKKKRTK